MRGLLALLLAASLDACANDADGAIDANVRPAIEGDWFVCAEPNACDALQPMGLRFDDQGLVHHLVAPLAPGRATIASGDPYCVGEAFADYEHDGAVLTLTFYHDDIVTTSELAIDDSGQRSTDGRMRKVRPNPSGTWEGTECE